MDLQIGQHWAVYGRRGSITEVNASGVLLQDLDDPGLIIVCMPFPDDAKLLTPLDGLVVGQIWASDRWWNRIDKLSATGVWYTMASIDGKCKAHTVRDPLSRSGLHLLRWKLYPGVLDSNWKPVSAGDTLVFPESGRPFKVARVVEPRVVDPAGHYFGQAGVTELGLVIAAKQPAVGEVWEMAIGYRVRVVRVTADEIEVEAQDWSHPICYSRSQFESGTWRPASGFYDSRLRRIELGDRVQHIGFTGSVEVTGVGDYGVTLGWGRGAYTIDQTSLFIYTKV